ncbi:MAG: PQQ-binding-like beta-propeller repeat protein [Gemmatimonadota bacterium]
MVRSATRSFLGCLLGFPTPLFSQTLTPRFVESSTMFRGDPAHTGVSPAKLFAGQGGVRWRVATGDAVRSSPAVTATRVFIGSGDGYLYAIERAAGRVVWRFAAGGAVDASPAVAGGLVIAATLTGRIFAVDEVAGRLRWSMRTGPALPLNGPRAAGWDLYASSPVVAGKTIVIGGQDGGVYALDLTTGRLLWRAETNGRVRATPAVLGGMVVVGSFDGRIYALDLATGAKRWVHHTIGDTLDSRKAGFDRRAVQSSAALAGGGVFVGSRDGGLYMLDAATGERRWRFTHRGSWVVGSPAVQGGRAYVGSSDGHFLQAVEAATGKEVWRLEVGSNILSSPLLIGDALIVGSANTGAPTGELLAVDRETGRVRWRLRFGDAVWSSPVVADGEIYVGSDDGGVYAINEVSRTIPKLAVFYDTTVAEIRSVPGSRLAFDYFRNVGYEHLGADSLPRFLEARIADGVPSAVVFAMDILPKSVASTRADTVLFRRYLEAGGKVVWLGPMVGAVARDSIGQTIEFTIERTEHLIGLSTATFDFDPNTAQPTAVGRKWGIDRWFRGGPPLATSAVSIPLAVDQVGMTSVWVRSFRPDRPGSGFVQLWGNGATAERLPLIRAAAEYGLLRSAAETRSSASR